MSARIPPGLSTPSQELIQIRMPCSQLQSTAGAPRAAVRECHHRASTRDVAPVTLGAAIADGEPSEAVVLCAS